MDPSRTNCEQSPRPARDPHESALASSRRRFAPGAPGQEWTLNTVSFAEVIRILNGLRARDATAAVLEGYSLADAAVGKGAEVFTLG